MDFTIFLKDSFLLQKRNVKTMLSSYDRDGGISDGLFSKKEALNLVNDAVDDWVLKLFGRKNVIKSIFKYLDKDNGLGKDGVISYQEVDDYLNKTYGLKLVELEPMTVEKACERVIKGYEEKKRSKKK